MSSGSGYPKASRTVCFYGKTTPPDILKIFVHQTFRPLNDQKPPVINVLIQSEIPWICAVDPIKISVSDWNPRPCILVHKRKRRTARPFPAKRAAQFADQRRFACAKLAFQEQTHAGAHGCCQESAKRLDIVKVFYRKTRLSVRSCLHRYHESRSSFSIMDTVSATSRARIPSSPFSVPSLSPAAP